MYAQYAAWGRYYITGTVLARYRDNNWRRARMDTGIEFHSKTGFTNLVKSFSIPSKWDTTSALEMWNSSKHPTELQKHNTLSLWEYMHKCGHSHKSDIAL